MTGLLMTRLDEWVAQQAAHSATAMLGAISATHLVKHRTGFGQTVVPKPGSVLASPVPASYDPDPDYFFHWYRDSAIIIDAMRSARMSGLMGDVAEQHLQEFVEFSLSLDRLDGRTFLDAGNFRQAVTPNFLQYLRDDADIARLRGDLIRGETRVNPDGSFDFTRWPRPQTDGPAMRITTLLRWWPNEKVAVIHPIMRALLEADIDYILAHAEEPSFDIWEEELGFHYYTQLVQTEALTQGAVWDSEHSQNERAEKCRAAATRLTSGLDTFWDPALGYYRSRHPVSGGIEAKALDASIILAIIHAARPSGPHSVLDPRAQATLVALEKLFDADYPINHDRPPSRGTAFGRYSGDNYYSGGAFYMTTLAAAEFYFRLATALLDGAEMPVTSDNKPFIERLKGQDVNGSSLAECAFRRGDSILETICAFTPADGALSEQFDRATGAQTSAKHLTWSYAAFITAAAQRQAAKTRLASEGLSGAAAGKA